MEALGADGSWVTVLEKFGYPAGMPRAMSVPLGELPVGTKALRIRTNLEIYWDRIRVVLTRPCDEARVNELTLSTASLARVGFAHRTTGPQRRPWYDYAKRMATWDTRHPSGYYTAFGEISQLLADRDDALAIIGPGEEAHFEFAAPAKPVAEGMTRYFVLAAAGWCKDMDMYTHTGGALGPLPMADPASAQSSRRAELHSKYNTRYQAGQ